MSLFSVAQAEIGRLREENRKLADQENKLLSERHDILTQLATVQEREGRLREFVAEVIDTNLSLYELRHKALAALAPAEEDRGEVCLECDGPANDCDCVNDFGRRRRR